MIMKKILTLGLVLSLLLSSRLVFAQDSQVIRLGQAMTTAGDMIINNTRAQPARLPIGSTGQILTVSSSGIPGWSSAITLIDPVVSGNLTFSTEAAKIIPGATSLTFRNNADSANNISITDAGAIGLRSSVTITDSAANIRRFSVVGTGGATISMSAQSTTGSIATENAFPLTFVTNNSSRWSINTSGALTQDATNGDSIVISKTATGLRTSTSDAADNIGIKISGGGGFGNTRGAGVEVYGNENVETGKLYLSGGNTAGGDIIFQTGTSTKWTISQASGTLVTPTSFGNDIGWSRVNAANQACNTTCSTGCVIGIDTLGTGGFLLCTDATADSCLCAGAS